LQHSFFFANLKNNYISRYVTHLAFLVIINVASNYIAKLDRSDTINHIQTIIQYLFLVATFVWTTCMAHLQHNLIVHETFMPEQVQAKYLIITYGVAGLIGLIDIIFDNLLDTLGNNLYWFFFLYYPITMCFIINVYYYVKMAYSIKVKGVSPLVRKHMWTFVWYPPIMLFCWIFYFLAYFSIWFSGYCSGGSNDYSLLPSSLVTLVSIGSFLQNTQGILIYIPYQIAIYKYMISPNSTTGDSPAVELADTGIYWQAHTYFKYMIASFLHDLFVYNLTVFHNDQIQIQKAISH